MLRNMILLKQKRFGQFLESIEGISSKMLPTRSHVLEDTGLISRRITSDRPAHIEYSLTDNGRDLEPLLEIVTAFTAKLKHRVYS
jgi:DNA-binding HxlR family transcriptional regulator